MSDENNKHVIWVVLKRLDLLLSGKCCPTPTLVTKNSDAKHVEITPGMKSRGVKQVLMTTFNIDSDIFSMKLRNATGSLVPLTNRIPANSKDMSYTLEVQRFQRTASSDVVHSSEPQQSYEQRIENIAVRIQKLENVLPELSVKKTEMITAEMKDLEQKLNFLNQRFKMAENSSWKGMFTKHPMW